MNFAKGSEHTIRFINTVWNENSFQILYIYSKVNSKVLSLRPYQDEYNFLIVLKKY